jgi:hypothetical protein
MNLKSEIAAITNAHAGKDVLPVNRPAVVQLGELMQAGEQLCRTFHGEDVPDWAYNAVEDFKKVLRKIESEVDD